MKIQFEAGEGKHFQGGVNYMLSEDGRIYAEVQVPENASEDFGYMTMKNAILHEFESRGMDASGLEFWYDGQEENLAADANATTNVYIDIEEDEPMSIGEFIEELFNHSDVAIEEINIETAEKDLENFRADGWNLPDGITAEEYRDAWNDLVRSVRVPKEISLDNGHSYLTAEEAMPEIIARNLWDVIVYRMDDDTREAVHADLAPCTNLKFLKEYLRRAPHNLIIG